MHSYNVQRLRNNGGGCVDWIKDFKMEEDGQLTTSLLERKGFWSIQREYNEKVLYHVKIHQLKVVLNFNLRVKLII